MSRMAAKSGTNDWVLAEFEACHAGKVRDLSCGFSFCFRR